MFIAYLTFYIAPCKRRGLPLPSPLGKKSAVQLNSLGRWRVFKECVFSFPLGTWLPFQKNPSGSIVTGQWRSLRKFQLTDVAQRWSYCNLQVCTGTVGLDDVDGSLEWHVIERAEGTGPLSHHQRKQQSLPLFHGCAWGLQFHSVISKITLSCCFPHRRESKFWAVLRIQCPKNFSPNAVLSLRESQFAPAGLAGVCTPSVKVFTPAGDKMGWAAFSHRSSFPYRQLTLLRVGSYFPFSCFGNFAFYWSVQGIGGAEGAGEEPYKSCLWDGPPTQKRTALVNHT